MSSLAVPAHWRSQRTTAVMHHHPCMPWWGQWPQLDYVWHSHPNQCATFHPNFNISQEERDFLSLSQIGHHMHAHTTHFALWTFCKVGVQCQGLTPPMEWWGETLAPTIVMDNLKVNNGWHKCAWGWNGTFGDVVSWRRELCECQGGPRS